MSDTGNKQHDFLVEIGTEELPPKALRALSEAFASGIRHALEKADIRHGTIRNYASPRRLAVSVDALATKAEDSHVEVWGPPVKICFDAQGNATKPALAFVEKNQHLGISIDSLKDCIANDGKADKLFVAATVEGIDTASVLESIINQSLEQLPVPKRMRWGNGHTEFVRPVHWAVVLFADHDPADFTIMGIRADRLSRGHRFHHPDPVTIASPKDYLPALREARVIADLEERSKLIREQVEKLGKAMNGCAVVSEDLLAEVTALNEWPVALSGRFDESFLNVPPEALISSMKEHQKYFHVVDEAGKLLPRFITVSNIESSAPEKVIAGNEKVIRPRLTDAAFFFETDKKTSQQQRRERLKTIVFQNKLGSIYDKTERVAKLAEHLAPQIQANPAFARRAGELSKSDLVSEMVLEFDDLQGLMGKYYAENDGEAPEIAAALFEQYLPRFSGDILPESPTGITLALADRLDTLAGIFGIGQVPTGSSDPFALRRASLGVLRLAIEKHISIDLSTCLDVAISNYTDAQVHPDTKQQVLHYILERFNAFYADIAPEIVQSVTAKKLTTPMDIHQRIQAVHEFAGLPAASHLATANKRVSNILAKNPISSSIQVDTALFEQPEEKNLYDALVKAEVETTPLVKQHAYQQALTHLAELQTPVDTFFDTVMVMVDDSKVKTNRLAILGRLQALFLNIADISLLSTK